MIGICLPLTMYRNSYEDYRMVISDLTYDDLSRSRNSSQAVSQKRCMIGSYAYHNDTVTIDHEDYIMVI